jgi:hypothetical protein
MVLYENLGVKVLVVRGDFWIENVEVVAVD